MVLASSSIINVTSCCSCQPSGNAAGCSASGAGCCSAVDAPRPTPRSQHYVARTRTGSSARRPESLLHTPRGQPSTNVAAAKQQQAQSRPTQPQHIGCHGRGDKLGQVRQAGRATCKPPLLLLPAPGPAPPPSAAWGSATALGVALPPDQPACKQQCSAAARTAARRQPSHAAAQPPPRRPTGWTSLASSWWASASLAASRPRCSRCRSLRRARWRRRPCQQGCPAPASLRSRSGATRASRASTEALARSSSAPSQVRQQRALVSSKRCDVNSRRHVQPAAAGSAVAVGADCSLIAP